MCKCRKCDRPMRYIYVGYGGYWRCTACGHRSVLLATDNEEELG